MPFYYYILSLFVFARRIVTILLLEMPTFYADDGHGIGTTRTNLNYFIEFAYKPNPGPGWFLFPSYSCTSDDGAKYRNLCKCVNYFLGCEVWCGGNTVTMNLI